MPASNRKQTQAYQSKTKGNNMVTQLCDERKEYARGRRMFARIIGIPPETVAQTSDDELPDLLWDNRELSAQFVKRNTDPVPEFVWPTMRPKHNYQVYADETLDEAASRLTFLTGRLITEKDLTLTERNTK